MLRLPLAVFRRVVAQDLLAQDAPWRDAIHRDAVLAHLARQAFGPRVHCRLGAEGAVDALRFGLAGDVDDAPPLVFHHLLQQLVRELALAREVERERFVPLLLRCVEREAAAAAGVVHQNVDRTQAIERRLGDRGRRLSLHEVAFDRQRTHAALGDDFAGDFFQQIPAPRGERQAHTLGTERQRDAAADATARPGDDRGFSGDFKIHGSGSVVVERA